MYTSLTVEGFRGFTHLEVRDLARVNLIVGDNGVGKTSLLEALFLLSGHANPELAFRIRNWRGLLVGPGARAEFENLFYKFPVDPEARIVGTIDGAVTSDSLELRLKPADTFTLPLRVDGEDVSNSAQQPLMTRVGDEVLEMEWMPGSGERATRYAAFYQRLAGPAVSEYGMQILPPARKTSPSSIFLQTRHPGNPDQENEQFSGIVQSQQRENMIKFLQRLDDRVRSVEILSANGGACVHVDIGEDRMMQLGLMGDGLARAARLYLSASGARDGLLMVDEVGNGLHYSALADGFWSGVWDAMAQFNVQLFATTHSEECLSAAYEAFDGPQAGDLAVHRLERVDGGIQCRSFDHATLGTALEMGFEVR